MDEKYKDELKEYRKTLLELEKSISERFDKILLSLSSGALAISIVYLKDIVGKKVLLYKPILFSSWGLLSVSLICTVFSFYVALLAHRKAIIQLDNQDIQNEKPGGVYGTLTEWLNLSSAITLCLGILFLFTFAFLNFS